MLYIMSESSDHMEDDSGMDSWTEVCTNARATDRSRTLLYLYLESGVLLARLRGSLAVRWSRD